MTMVIEDIPTNIGAIDFAVTPCVEYDGNVIVGETRVVRYNGTKCEGNVEDPREISVMSFNMLNVWHDGTNKLEPIFYDNTQYDVVDSGVFDFVEWELNSVEYEYAHSFADGNKSDARSLVWGVFKHKTTEEMYIVSNTHFNAEFTGTADLTWTEVSKQEWEFVAQKLNDLYSEYGCPVIACGDYNTRKLNTNGYKTVLAGDFYDTWEMAAEKTDSSGYHADCKNRSGYDSSVAPSPNNDYALDHILSKTKLNVTSYEIIIDKTFTGYTYVDSVLDLSDHCPVIMHFTTQRQELGIVVGNAEDKTVAWR